MGCAIHLHVEVKINGRWEHWEERDIGRNYPLFARMANVRNYFETPVTPISEPRGLPDDINGVTKLEHKPWGADAHSESWLSKEEMDQLNDFKAFPWVEGGHRFSVYPDDFPEGVEDVRLVFWFDN